MRLRMNQCQFRSVQGLARKSQQGATQFGRNLFWHPLASAVNGIADDGIADVGQVYADLVRATSLQLH